MCGIAGALFSDSKGQLRQIIDKMRDTFVYRGPDDRGTWINAGCNVGLGHRRLSILDTSPNGHQPMHDVEAMLTIVFNGEVYNYIEIRDELKGHGYSFKTGTDTEVILKAYAKWGKTCVGKFNGMFAFAIWDDKKKELFLVRDRLGIKPLYYYQSDGQFYFASEVKAILSVLPSLPQLREELIDSYMSFGYIPGSETLQTGINRQLPGHYMVLANGVSRQEQYWDLHFNTEHDKGEAYYIETFSSLLNDAIDLRLRSDVPLGIFLSGGLDSSTVVGMLAPRVTERLKTFSVAYDFGKQFDETSYARLIAKKFNTDHAELFVSPAQFMDFIPQFVKLMDEPVTEAAALSLYFVSMLAKEKVTVVLSGEGADEILAGYDLYRYMTVLEKYHRLVGNNGTALLASIAEKFLPVGNKISKYFRLGAIPLERRYKGISTYEEIYKKRLYTADFRESCRKQKETNADVFLDSLFQATRGRSCLDRMLYFDTKSWLVDDLLIKADRMSMAASLELRVPFLDYRLVEFAATIPPRYKVNRKEGKVLLKKLMKGVLPPEIIHRKKMGFPTPLKIMFQNQLYDFARDRLLSKDAKIARYFKLEEISKLLMEHSTGRLDHHRTLWQLLVLEVWLREYSPNH